MNNSMNNSEPGSGGNVRPRLTVVSGPSGVGKSTVVRELRKLDPRIYLSVSATTRAPRPGEVHGDHYHFIDQARYDEMVEHKEFLEHAHYAGNNYGTPRAAIEQALADGRPAVLEIELQGARQIRRSMPEAQLVMLVPPSWQVLVNRLTGRGTEDPAKVARRLAVAKDELAAEDEFDVVVVNDDVKRAARELLTLVVGTTSLKLQEHTE